MRFPPNSYSLLLNLFFFQPWELPLLHVLLLGRSTEGLFGHII